MGGLAWVLLAGAIAITGLALLELAGCRCRSGATRFGLALGAGLVATTLILKATLLATSELLFWPLLLVYALASVLWLARMRRPGAIWRPVRRDLFFLPVALAFLAVLESSGTVPFNGYDSKAIYGIKAKALLHERDLNGTLFQDPDVVHYHRDYPLGLPLLMALSAWAAEGEPEDPDGLQPSASVLEWVRRYDAVDHYMPLATLWVLALVLVVSGHIRERGFGALASLRDAKVPRPGPVGVELDSVHRSLLGGDGGAEV